MIGLVKFTEFVNSKREKHLAKSETYYLNPRKVSAVLPRKRYTTIVADGHYYHVIGTFAEVQHRLGAWTR